MEAYTVQGSRFRGSSSVTFDVTAEWATRVIGEDLREIVLHADCDPFAFSRFSKHLLRALVVSDFPLGILSLIGRQGQCTDHQRGPSEFLQQLCRNEKGFPEKIREAPSNETEMNHLVLSHGGLWKCVVITRSFNRISRVIQV